MSKSFCLYLMMCLGIVPLFAMQQNIKQQTLFVQLAENQFLCRYIAGFLDHQACAYVRQSCKQLDATFWNDSLPITLWPDSDTKAGSEENYWNVLLAKIAAVERMIKKFNPDNANAIVLKLCWGRSLTTLPEGFGKTMYVRSFDLAYTNVPGTELAKLPRLLPLLHELDMVSGVAPGRAVVLECIPPEFAEWKSLRRLLLGGNFNVIGSSADNIPRQLEYLDLSCCGCATPPFFLSKISQLKGLDISGNPLLTIETLSSLHRLTPILEELNLSHNNLQILPDEFYNLKKLYRLKLYANNLSPEALKKLPEIFPLLEELDLGLNRLSTLPQEFEQFHRLKILHLDGITAFDDEGESTDNCFSPKEREKICCLLPTTKIIF